MSDDKPTPAPSGKTIITVESADTVPASYSLSTPERLRMTIDAVAGNSAVSVVDEVAELIGNASGTLIVRVTVSVEHDPKGVPL